MSSNKTYEYQSNKVLPRYTIIEEMSITPQSLCLYKRFYNNYEKKKLDLNNNLKRELASMGLADIVQEKKIRNSVSHNFELSKQAQKNLRKKVNWLYYYANKKTIVTKKGKTLTNFKMNFVTLKLPSEQIHTSDFITKNCLNQLITEISKKYSFDNYVWRLEYQDNGNLHYHIATDTYIDYEFLLKTWNRILNKYGYVDLYQRKFSAMSFEQYRKSQSNYDNNDFKILQERYAKGCRENWKNPNSVDVKAVFNKSNIAFYISKYMVKGQDNEKKRKLPICENNSSNSRLWFCSRSLSKLKSVHDFRDAPILDVFEIIKSEQTVRVFYSDYATILYYDYHKLSAFAKNLLRDYFNKYKEEQLYKPCP